MADPHSITDHLAPSKKSARSDLIEADEDGYISSDFAGSDDDDDEVYSQIRDRIVSGAPKNKLAEGDESVASLDRLSTSEGFANSTSGHCSLTYGFIPKGCYNHPIKSGAILGICHNPRYRQFHVLDAKGITSWKYDCRTGPPVVRQLNYPSYQYRLYSNLVYDKKHNVYFCLGKDFSLKILNHQFQETYTVEANLRNVMFLLYNPKREELITGGVGGSKVWQFVQVLEDKGWTEVKAMSNYKLQHKYTLRNVGGGWVKKVAMDHRLAHLYCCSETDLFAYSLNNGDELFNIKRAHDMSITGCVYSPSAQYIVTSSNDSTVKCWIVNGGLVHTFRCHTKAVTQVMSHPDASSLVLSCSADCSIKLLCLDTLNVLYTITVSSDGVQWMGLTHENILWACTARQITMWNLNHFVDFFALSRSTINKLSLQSAPKKSTRLLSVGDDSCVRLFSSYQRKHLCSVLPMPCISALEQVKAVCYSRELNLVYCLINHTKIWIYTTRTDPACRIAQWDFAKIQESLIKRQDMGDSETSRKDALLRKLSPHRAMQDLHTHVEICDCTAIATLNSRILLWSDEGWVGTIPTKFLLVGLSDGRVLFMDPFVRGLLHVDFRANKDTIRDIRHEKTEKQLLTQCDRNEVAIIQLWSLPTLQLLHELCIFQDITASTRLNDSLLYGYSDGSVSFHELEDVDEDNFNRRTNQIKNMEELRHSGLVNKRIEHREKILSIDVCAKKQLYLTSSSDMMIKIWTADDQCVIADVSLNKTLTCAAFLNSSADIVFSFANNIYSVAFKTLCPELAERPVRGTYAESITAESDIYEDPATTHEGIIPNIDPLDLRNYLKPYELDITKDFLEATDIVVRPQTRELVEEESEIMSNAPTEIYISPTSTPRLSRMDVFTPQPVNWDQLSTHSGRAKSAASERTASPETVVDKQAVFDQLDVTNPDHADFYLPMFGDSPGGTPSVSSFGSVADSRSDLDDISDFEMSRPGSGYKHRDNMYEFGSEYGSQENLAEGGGTARSGKVKPGARPTAVLPIILSGAVANSVARINMPEAKNKKKKQQAPHELVLTLEPDDEEDEKQKQSEANKYINKYGIDKMKVDVGALLKEGTSRKKIKKVSVSAAPPTVADTSGEQAASIALRQSLQAGASELSSKKKKAAGGRKRAPVAAKKVAEPPPTQRRQSEIMEEKEQPKPVVQPAAKKEKVKTVSGTLASGLIPAVAPTAPKKELAKRRGQVIEAKTTPSYPANMVKIAIGDSDLNPHEDQEDDVDLSTYMDMDDEMECKSAASWNPKYGFEAGEAGKDTPSKQSSSSTVGPRASSGRDIRTADSNLRVSGSQRTPGLSERMSDMDAMSIQMDAYDDIVEDHVTPQPSVSESAADYESTTRSGVSPIRLPNLLPDLEENGGVPTRSDALSRWLMGSVPGRAGSVAESEAPTRPGRKSRSSIKGTHVKIDLSSQGDGTEARPNSAVSANLTRSSMLGLRTRRPHTAPLHVSFENLQEEFDEALLRFQGDTDINRLFRNTMESFDENWQEKLIERHKLLSMQKELRAKSAVHRRQAYHQQLMDKRHSLLGHRHCDGVIDPETDDEGETIQSRLRSSKSTKSLESNMRLTSAASKPIISVRLTEARLRSSKYKNGASEPHAAPLLEKANLINETQVNYRFRINESLCQQLHKSLKPQTPLHTERQPDSVAYDPRRPDSVKHPGPRSIPSRCTRFVLVKQKKSNARPSSPSALERELLSQRFPPASSRRQTPRLDRSVTLMPHTGNKNLHVSISAYGS